MSPRTNTAVSAAPTAPKSNRAIWKGVITAGMLNVPVRVLAATDDRTVAFSNVHDDCGSRLKQRMFCPVHNVEVPSDQQAKAYQISKDVFVRVPQAEIDSLDRPSAHTIELAQIVAAGEIDPSLHEKTYYLEPDAVGGRAFALLAAGLQKRKRVGVGRIMLRTRERVCVIRPLNGSLVLDTLLYPDELRPQPVQPMLVPNKQELDMAVAWLDMAVVPFDASLYRDEYREAVLAILTRAVATAEPMTQPSGPSTSAAPDLMAQLRASLEQAKKAKEPAPVAEPKPKRTRKPKAQPEGETPAS